VAALGLAAALLGAAACGDDSGDDASTDTTKAAAEYELQPEAAQAAVDTYADLVYKSYSDVVDGTAALNTAIDRLTDAPTEATLAAAKQAWLDARALYGPTEAFRFYDGPIDDPEDGPEGQINAWPLDEAYIDYVQGDAEAGIVNDVAGVPEITTDVLVAANEKDGETNISTGWHAIEFLLWGQDLSDDGPGNRPVTDYTTAPNAQRRATYLSLLGQLLLDDLTSVRDQWAPDADNYRADFVADPDQAISDIFRSMGALSQGELAGERIGVAYDSKDQEDEHSCFSDNTTVDILGNAKGIRMVYTADHPGIDGPSLSDAVKAVAPELDAALLASLDDNVAKAEALEAPFDQLFLGDDDAPGRVELLALITGLQDQGDLVAKTAGELGFSISLEIG
jgi:putative iron-regulated protein